MLQLGIASAGPPTPKYPRQMSYRARMQVSADSKDMFAGNNFTGSHYLNADTNVMRTEWLMTCPKGTCGRFGASPTSVGLNAHGKEGAIYQTVANTKEPMGPGGAQPVLCMKLPWTLPVFNESWANDAVYRGVHYLDGQLCHRWSNTVPWAVQRVQRISDYYSDFYTNLPVASISVDGAVDLRFSELNVNPMPDSLFDVTGLNCHAPPHPPNDCIGTHCDQSVLLV